MQVQTRPTPWNQTPGRKLFPSSLASTSGHNTATPSPTSSASGVITRATSRRLIQEKEAATAALSSAAKEQSTVAADISSTVSYVMTTAVAQDVTAPPAHQQTSLSEYQCFLLCLFFWETAALDILGFLVGKGTGFLVILHLSSKGLGCSNTVSGYMKLMVSRLCRLYLCHVISCWHCVW